MKGDWSSLLILDPYHIENVVPMSPTTISQSIRYHHGSKEEVVVDEFNNPIMFNNLPIKCKSGWNVDSNLMQFSGAITALHKANKRVNEYVWFCSACKRDFDLWKQEKSEGIGCIMHRFRAKHFPDGNPMTADTVVEECKVFYRKAMLHEPKSCTQLSPSEVSLLYQSLSPSYKVFDFMIYVMVIIATALGLRHDEFGSIKMEDFRMDLSMIYDDCIDNVVVMIKGKNDVKAVPLKLIFQDVVPEFCPCRLLLIWIWFMDLRGDGFLFPTKAELNSLLDQKISKGGTSFTSKMHYDVLLYDVKKKMSLICNRNFQPLGDVWQRNFGTHIFRKTFYLFGKLGGGLHHDLKESARHKSDETAAKVRRKNRLNHMLQFLL